MSDYEDYGHLIPSRRSDPVTSHLADEAITIPARSYRARLLVAFARTIDATDDQAAEIAGISLLSCYWKRCSELREDGLIEATGAMRPGWSGQYRLVCQITDRGWAALRGEYPLSAHTKAVEPVPLDTRKVATLRRLADQAVERGWGCLPLDVVWQVLNHSGGQR